MYMASIGPGRAKLAAPATAREARQAGCPTPRSIISAGYVSFVEALPRPLGTPNHPLRLQEELGSQLLGP